MASRRGSAQHLGNPALGEVGRSGNKECALREGGQVFVGLDSAEVKDRFGLLRPHQLEYAGVRTNEILIVHLDNAMRVIGRFHRIHRDDVETIWNGPQAQMLRNHVATEGLFRGCSGCFLKYSVMESGTQETP